MKRVIILGATGSIGVNCLNCVQQHPEHYSVSALSTHVNVDLVLQQAKTFSVKYVAVTGGNVKPSQLLSFDELGVKTFIGPRALVDLLEETTCDILVNAVVGAAGFTPTLKALQQGITVALANKETLVLGGKMVMNQARISGAAILPIDSEHSAIFQCLMGENRSDIEELVLTASGGPFREKPVDQLKNITPAQALKHPNWNMGKKITIDSATMMNKGLEVIEARWLFDVEVDRIRVLIHPQSIIHSMVVFHDGSVKAQLGVPDMRIPIQLALSYPLRRVSDFPRLDFYKLKELTFAEPDLRRFKCLSLAFEALRAGGTLPAVLNAANEVAVEKFLQQAIRFDQIPDVIEKALQAHETVSEAQVEDVLESDRWAREFVLSQCH